MFTFCALHVLEKFLSLVFLNAFPLAYSILMALQKMNKNSQGK